MLQDAVEVGVVHRELGVGAGGDGVVHAGQAGQAVDRHGGVDGHLRAREVPELLEGAGVGCALPARTMVSRSQSASTSERMWLESRTVLPEAFASRTTSWKTAIISGSRPEVGSSSR